MAVASDGCLTGSGNSFRAANRLNTCTNMVGGGRKHEKARCHGKYNESDSRPTWRAEYVGSGDKNCVSMQDGS